jgi:hypothetical protein
VLYDPAGQVFAVGVVEPSGQKCPAVQGPVHVADIVPGAAPYRPAGHGVPRSDIDTDVQYLHHSHSDNVGRTHRVKQRQLRTGTVRRSGGRVTT